MMQNIKFKTHECDTSVVLNRKPHSQNEYDVSNTCQVKTKPSLHSNFLLNYNNFFI